MCIQEKYRMDDDQDGSGKDLDKRTLLVNRLSKSVTREDLEAAFSEVGVVRHCVVVTERGGQESRGFGFVSFSLPEDAELALKELQGTSIGGQEIRLSYANRRERNWSLESRGSEDANQEPRKPRIKAYRVEEGDLPKASRQTTPIVVVEHTTVDAVNSVLQGLKKVVKVEEKDGAVVVVFNRFKTARAKISKLHGLKSSSGISHAFFQSEARRRERLIVRNLPFSAEEKELKEVFGKYGPLREVHLPKKPDGKARGFAFVEYFHGVDAMSAVKTANGAKLGSRTLAVDIAVAKNKYLVLQDEAVPEEDEQDQPSDMKQNESEDDDEKAERGYADEGDAEGDKEESEENEGHREPQRAESTDEEILRTVFVRNVLLETTANELRLELKTFGDVEHCVLVKDKATGRSRGSAFVRFRDQSSVPKILKESGYDTAAGMMMASQRVERVLTSSESSKW
uniref:RRM domain-containing protein n=1 Tax=Rhodosorus marinus TaxID=101924 RepID=A0A7S3EBF9_9RHOD